MKNRLVFLIFFGILSFQFVQAQQIDEKELKINIKELAGSTDALYALQPVSFEFDVAKYSQLGLPTGSQYGFLTAVAKEKSPEIVREEAKVYNTGKNTTKVARMDAVDTDKLIPLLVAAIKDQQAQIEALRLELEAIKAKQ